MAFFLCSCLGLVHLACSRWAAAVVVRRPSTRPDIVACRSRRPSPILDSAPDVLRDGALALCLPLQCGVLPSGQRNFRCPPSSIARD